MKKLILIVTLLLNQQLLNAQSTITSVNPGLWSNPTTWDLGIPQNGVLYDATTNPQYTFTGGGSFDHRFNIIIPNILVSVNDVYTQKESNEKTIIKTTNFLGQHVDKDTKGFIVHFYNDGTYLKVFNR